MKPPGIKFPGIEPVRAGITAAAAVILAAAVWFSLPQQQVLVIEDMETGELYAGLPVRPGDTLTFRWEHSFEHIPWYEFYEILEDGTFLLHRISVAGFGAGIPAEMDCEYSYEDGMIVMDGIESRFPEFNWIHSQTALKTIELNGSVVARGPDMPHHRKLTLSVKNKKIWKGR